MQPLITLPHADISPATSTPVEIRGRRLFRWTSGIVGTKRSEVVDWAVCNIIYTAEHNGGTDAEHPAA
jgi:hypothetical protein